MAIDECVCEAHYWKGDEQKSYQVQFFDIASAYGQWYATAFNFDSNKPQVFRCDKIQSVRHCNRYAAKSLSELLIPAKKMFRDNDAINFEVGISTKGVDLFYKEHYPSMELLYDKDRPYIKGFYNKGEEPFIANYFMSYGETIFSIQPISLKNLILKQLEAIKNHFNSM